MNSACVDAAGILRRTNRGVVEIAGKDRASFLHGMLSSNVAGLAAGKGQSACLLNRTGHLQADMTVLATTDAILLLAGEGSSAFLAAELEKHHFAEKVVITDVSPRRVRVAVLGPRSADIVSQAFAVAAPQIEGDHIEVEFQGSPMRIVALRASRDPGFELLMEPELADEVAQRLRDAGAADLSDEAAERLRIEAGLPKAPNEINATILGPELVWDRPFAKGKCYPGQEVVARIAARGHVNRMLAGLSVAGSVSPTDKVRVGEREVGTVTSVAPVPETGGAVALAILRADVVREGCAVTIEHAGSAVPATVRPLDPKR